MNKKELDKLIEERNKTHGDWNNQISGCKRIYDELYNEYWIWCKGKNIEPNETAMGSLFFIAGKISRMIHGDPTFDDHIDDLSNYLKFFKETR